MKRAMFFVILLVTISGTTRGEDIGTIVKEYSKKDIWTDVNKLLGRNDSDQLFFAAVLDFTNALREKRVENGRETMRDAEKLLKFAESNAGREFENGAKLGKTSNLQLYAYGKMVNANVRNKNCAAARSAFEEFKNVYETDYTVVSLERVEVFVPGKDVESYETAKKADRIDRLSDLNLADGGCFDGGEYSEWMKEYDEAKFFRKFRELRDYAFGYWEKDPRNGIRKAEEIIELVNSYDGHVFSGGEMFRAESSLMIYAYDAMMNAYEHRNKCREAGDYFHKLESMAADDYLVVVPETGDVYDPAADADVYKEMRRQDLTAIRDYVTPKYRCYKQKKYEELFQ